jgi:SAM-dependent methyltransferase
MMASFNVYEDKKRAEAYAKLAYPGTYYLAYRDLPAIIGEHAKGKRALDFGCGGGRSTRFLRELGFSAVGVDISHDMIRQAREIDPEGEYLCIEDADFSGLRPKGYDLILSAFTFDNIPTMERKVRTFAGLRGLLDKGGVILNLVSSPDIYLHEWASFSTKDFPENRKAKSGDEVRIIITDVEDSRPVVDIVWSDEDYEKVYSAAGLRIVEKERPLAREDEPYEWVTETRIAPWVVYLLETVKPGGS